MSYEEAAAVPLGGLEAMHVLRQANIRSGQQVLVIGAGGTIGTFGVQLAKHFGAEVTGVDSGEKLEMIRAIGADHVIDYTREDFAKAGQTYDVIFDAPGKSSFSRCQACLKPGGQFLSANPEWSQQLRTAWGSMRGRKPAAAAYTSPTKRDLAAVRELLEAGKVRSIIDRRYPLEKTADAHRYAETARKKGNIVITVA
jgi:NADPH:quinone reductase-like Zn-dependent oxidoreductase